jgi:ATP-dependent Clp protease ATP-binding subunit ClpA
VFERFTERARQVIVLAQDEARLLKHTYIGTEHLLLGLLREQEGIAASVLSSFDVTADDVRAQVAQVVGEGDEAVSGQIPFTPRAKKVLELSLREALSLGHDSIGTEHQLLALVRENGGVAARILLGFGVTSEAIREEVIGTLAGVATPPEYERRTPLPLAAPPELRERFDTVRAAKEAAIESTDFEEAARLREQERAIAREAREASTAWTAPDEWAARSETQASRTYDSSWLEGSRVVVLVATALAATAFPLGLLVGWLIWG